MTKGLASYKVDPRNPLQHYGLGCMPVCFRMVGRRLGLSHSMFKKYPFDIKKVLLQRRDKAQNVDGKFVVSGLN